MAIKIKTPADIETLREGGRRHSLILNEVAKAVVPGISAEELDSIAARLIKEGGDESAFLGYKPRGAKRPYPASLCVSINDEVVHGVPNESRKILKEGDIVSLDLGLKHKGLITDMAITVPVGNIDERAKKLLKATKKALELGISAASGKHTTGHIGEAVESYILPMGFGIVEELAGHGVGYSVHEDPFVPNFGKAGSGDPLMPGMVIAIEPIISEGDPQIKLDPDGYTYRTRDGSRTAHFEHTVLITKNGCEVLTKI